MLEHAFEVRGYERIALKTDVANTRSAAAIARLGATPEGVLRHHIRRPDGSWRDSVIFSILLEEWSATRDKLEKALADRGGSA
jgi:RimJ/RimL family protein N-acetyltransferase